MPGDFVPPEGCKLGTGCRPEYQKYERRPAGGSGDWTCTGPCVAIKPCNQDPSSPTQGFTPQEQARLNQLKHLFSDEGAGSTWKHMPVFGCEVLWLSVKNGEVVGEAARDFRETVQLPLTPED